MCKRRKACTYCKTLFIFACTTLFVWYMQFMPVFASTLTYLPYEDASYELTYRFDLGVGGIVITGYQGTAEGELVLPDGIDGISVVAIDPYAFMNCSGFEGDIIIGSSVESIGKGAFAGCTGLNKQIYLTENTTDIDSLAFGLSSMDIYYGYVTNAEEITIHAPEGSYGEEYANAFGFSYSSVTYDELPHATAVSLDTEKISLLEGKAGLLSVTVEPENCVDTIKWKSSDETVATVSDDGVIYAVSPGEATITVKVASLSASCNVIVSEWSESSFVESTLSTDYSNQLNNIYPEPAGECRTSFVGKLPDGGYQTVIYDAGILYIENFDEDYCLTEAKQLELELPVWGGIFLGESYNYVVCGTAYNESLPKGGTVYKVIKYDKDFNRLDSISFSGDDTYTSEPFDAGNVSMDEENGILTIYTSRERLDLHQSNIAFHINTSDMTLHDGTGMVSMPDIHVSHSFRQIVKYDAGQPIYVDLSDGAPERSVYIQYGDVGKALLAIAGQAGHNVTNAEVSGLEISDTHYLVVGSYLNGGNPNIFLSGINKSTEEVEVQWLTDSNLFVPRYVHNPQIIRIKENRFVIMWEEMQQTGEQQIQYVIVDGEGKIHGGLKQMQDIGMTDCAPILDDNKLLWMSVENGKKAFVEIEDFSETGVFELTNSIVEPVNPWDGTVDTNWYHENETSFEITTPQQLAGLAELVAGGNSFVGKTVYLKNDIFMNDESYTYYWAPIETWEGTFHGEGHSIYNLKTAASSAEGGLFAVVAESGSVKAVNFKQGMFNAGGCVADTNYGIIAFCNNYSVVAGIGDNDTGGICNTNYNLVYGCKNCGEVNGGTVGGIVGINKQTLGVVSQCSNWGIVGGRHYVGGIAAYNYGWIYNCYNRGVISNSYVGNGLNRASSLSGIVHFNYSTDVESCYSIGSYTYDSELYGGVYAINMDGDSENIVNCYTLPIEGYAKGATVLTADQMKTKEFVDRLNVQTNTMLKAWVADDEMINGGYPITVADDNYAHGIYKIQPELWTTAAQKLEMETGGKADISYQYYYNEEAPIVLVDDTSIVRATCLNGYIIVEALRSGYTYLTIHFNETESVVAADYVITIVVDGVEPDDNMFVDVPEDSWMYRYVEFVVNRNLMAGKGINPGGKIKFDPSNTITRAEFVRILYNKELKPKMTYKDIFADVPDGTWYTDAILWAYDKGIVTGKATDYFDVNGEITRLEIAQILYKYALYKGYDISKAADTDLTGFVDDETVAGWGQKAMKWAVKYGVITGKTAEGGNALSPDGKAIRAEAATMMNKFMIAYEGDN